jgi:hypothetical protein
VNDLYKENYKLLNKEIEEDYRRWKDLCLWIGRINIVKMAIIPKTIYMCIAVPIKIPMTFISEIEKSTLKFIWKHKRLQITQTMLSKNSNAGGKDQWNRIENPDMKSHSYTNLIFDKGTKNIQWRKDSLFNKCCWEKWLSVCKKLKLDPCLSPSTSINSKWIRNLNIRPDTLKLVQEGAGNSLEVIDVGKDFLNRTPAAQQLKERMDKWNFIKLKSFYTTKEMISKLETTHRVGENICH